MTDLLPRPLTPLARRRAWTDPRVRSWWILAIVLLVIAVYLGVQQYRNWSVLERAIGSGVIVQAKILSAESATRPRNISAGMPVVISYDYNGKNYRHKDVTLSGAKAALAVGGTVPIYIDPQRPEDWTAQDRVPPLSVAMVGTMLVTPVGLIAALVAFMTRSRLLRTYRDGQRVEGFVTANRQTPLAPRCRAIHCTIAASRRAIEVFVPPSLAKLGDGERLWLILPQGAGRPIAKAWFEDAE